MSVLPKTHLSVLRILQRELCGSIDGSRALMLKAVTALDFGDMHVQAEYLGAA